MTITREQVADLQPGDVVEVTAGPAWPNTVLRGEVFGPESNRCVGPMSLSENWGELVTLTVVSRAPRPLYVNHPRTEPVPRDVVLAPDGNGETQVWICITYITGEHRPHFVKPERSGMSHALPNGSPDSRMCQPFRLLVDGETGQVVP